HLAAGARRTRRAAGIQYRDGRADAFARARLDPAHPECRGPGEGRDLSAARRGSGRRTGQHHHHRWPSAGADPLMRAASFALALLAPVPAMAEEARSCEPADLNALAGWHGVWVAERLMADINGREPAG